MRQSLKHQLMILTLSFFVLAQFACKKEDEAQSASTSSTVQVDPSTFGVKVSPPAGTSMVLHLDGDWTQTCEVPSGSTSKNLYCILEANELDLYALGSSLVYNFPSTTCDFGRFYPYFYYQFLPGTGASLITQTTVDGGTPSFTSSGESAGVTTYFSGSTPACSVDYTSVDGPNCCEGSYNMNLVTVDTVAGTTTTTQTSGKWNGLSANCLTGPGVDSQNKNKNGYPLSTLFYLNNKAVSGTYPLTAPADKGFATNVYLANYFVGDATYSLASAPTPFRGPNTSVYRAAQPWYEFQCLDHNDEIIHRISILIRSWSKQSEFISHGSSTVAGPEGIPFDFSDYFDRAGWPGTGSTPGVDTGWGNTYPQFSN
jgi:hypothetical protein